MKYWGKVRAKFQNLEVKLGKCINVNVVSLKYKSHPSFLVSYITSPCTSIRILYLYFDNTTVGSWHSLCKAFGSYSSWIYLWSVKITGKRNEETTKRNRIHELYECLKFKIVNPENKHVNKKKRERTCKKTNT